MLDEPAAENDHASARGVHGNVVEFADVAGDGDVEDGGAGAEGVEVEHVAQGAVGEGGAEHGDAVPVGPVEDGGFVGDFGAEAGDDGAGGPDEAVLRVVGGCLVGFGGGFLLREHGVEDRDDPVLKGTVVAVGHDEVANAVHAFFPQVGAVGAEGGKIGGGEAFDQVLFDAAGRRDDGGDVAVLDEVAEGGAEARGDEIGGVAEEDGRFGAGFWVPEAAHVVDDADGVSDGAGLETHIRHVGDEFDNGDVTVRVVVEVDARDLLDVGWDGGGGSKDGVCGYDGGFDVCFGASRHRRHGGQ